jgi:hypothetical protein
MGSWTTSPDLLGRLLKAHTTAQVEAIMAALPIVPPDEFQLDYGDKPTGNWKPDHLHWLPVGLERGNGGRIKLAGEPMNPIAERTVNGMEAIIELARLTELQECPTAVMPANPRDAAMRYFGFPHLDSIERMDDEERKAMRELVDKVRNRLAISLAHDQKSNTISRDG